MKRSFEIVLLLSYAVLTSGCKLAAIIVEGGEVQSTSLDTCTAGNVCVFEVTDTSFSNIFWASPENGWYFRGWNSGDGFLCGGSTQNSCRLSLEGSDGNSALEEVIASSETVYLMPVFKQFEDVITVDGKQWLQPSLFAGVSPRAIRNSCPEGICVGELGEYDMTGWTWASVEDMNSLFNYYLGAKLLGPGPDGYPGGANNRSWSSDFFSDGWRPSTEPSTIILESGVLSNGWWVAGWASDFPVPNCVPDCLYVPKLVHCDDQAMPAGGGVCSTRVTTHESHGGTKGKFGVGAWFYRDIERGDVAK